MLRKTWFYVVTLIIGICLLFCVVGLRMWNILPKSIEGICLGLGGSLFGISLSKLIMKRMEKKDPVLMKNNEIEFNDERNTMIRNRAKAQSADIMQWGIMGIAYLSIIINTPLWVTLLIVVVFLFYNILTFYFMKKFQEEM